MRTLENRHNIDVNTAIKLLTNAPKRSRQKLICSCSVGCLNVLAPQALA